MNKQVQLRKELKKLQEAFVEITKLWHEETEICDKVLEPDYPFNSSFDELSSEVNEWVETAREKLTPTFEYAERVKYNGSGYDYYFLEYNEDDEKILISNCIPNIGCDYYDDWWVDAVDVRKYNEKRKKNIFTRNYRTIR